MYLFILLNIILNGMEPPNPVGHQY